jgi:hypothetical protein
MPAVGSAKLTQNATGGFRLSRQRHGCALVENASKTNSESRVDRNFRKHAPSGPDKGPCLRNMLSHKSRELFQQRAAANQADARVRRACPAALAYLHGSISIDNAAPEISIHLQANNFGPVRFFRVQPVSAQRGCQGFATEGENAHRLAPIDLACSRMDQRGGWPFVNWVAGAKESAQPDKVVPIRFRLRNLKPVAGNGAVRHQESDPVSGLGSDAVERHFVDGVSSSSLAGGADRFLRILQDLGDCRMGDAKRFGKSTAVFSGPVSGDNFRLLYRRQLGPLDFDADTKQRTSDGLSADAVQRGEMSNRAAAHVLSSNQSVLFVRKCSFHSSILPRLQRAGKLGRINESPHIGGI